MLSAVQDDHGRPLLAAARSVVAVVRNFHRKRSNVLLCHFCWEILLSVFKQKLLFTFPQVIGQHVMEWAVAFTSNLSLLLLAYTVVVVVVVVVLLLLLLLLFRTQLI